MTITPDLTVVETLQGTFTTVEYTGQVVPIHYVADLRVLMMKGHWSIESLERHVIGRPAEHPSRTVRLFVVLPEVSLTKLRIRELTDLLKVYANRRDRDLSVKLTYYPYLTGRSEQECFNIRDYDKGQRRLSIDIISKEYVDYVLGLGKDAGSQILDDMHIRPGRDYQPEDKKTVNIDAMIVGARLVYPLNTEYDYTVLEVHRIAGDKPHRARYSLMAPSLGVG